MITIMIIKLKMQSVATDREFQKLKETEVQTTIYHFPNLC